MRLPWLCGAFATALVLCEAGVPALGDTAQTAQTAQMQTAYDAQCADIVRGDFDDFAKFLSPAYTAHMEGQTLSRDEVIAQMKSIAGEVTVTKCSTTVNSVTESAGALVVTVQRVLDGSQSSTPFEIVSGDRDIWTTAADGPKEASSTLIWATTSVNGQIVRQSGIVPTPTPAAPPCGVTPAPSATP